MNVHKKHITDIGDEISVINWHPYLAIAMHDSESWKSVPHSTHSQQTVNSTTKQETIKV